jgi:hypothetical protein
MQENPPKLGFLFLYLSSTQSGCDCFLKRHNLPCLPFHREGFFVQHFVGNFDELPISGRLAI